MSVRHVRVGSPYDRSMDDTFEIRRAAPADARVIAHHRADMFCDMGQLPPALYTELVDRTVAYLGQAIPSGEYVGWLAFVQGSSDAIAGAGVQLRRILPRPAAQDGEHRIAVGREAIVLNVYTERTWRRKGLARLLMQHVLEWARGADLDRLVLHASDEGRALYEHLGFETSSEMRFARPLR
jgi:GNAT superfamily N-acetyltransferase